MKLKESGSISDSERLNLIDSAEEIRLSGRGNNLDENNLIQRDQFQPTESQEIEMSTISSPFKSNPNAVEVTIYTSSPKSSKTQPPINLPTSDDKILFDDRQKGSFFDPNLARSSLPKIFISIGGMLFIGYFLNIIIKWTVFTNVPELFVLIPVILNLRGILEQGLTSRLAKASRIGVMESISGRKKIWLGNLNLVMFQSITAGLLAGLMACFLSWISHSEIKFWRSILMLVVASATSASTSIISGFFLFLVLQAFKKIKRSPDDLLGPLTASFGGFISLFILAIYAGFFYLWMGSWLGIMGVIVLLIAGNIYFYSKAQRNEAVGTLTSEGWLSILFSLLVTGLSGLLLQKFISKYQSVFALLLPVFTGINGNFAGIYCSEAITHLHLFQLNSLLPRKTALTLLCLSNPFQIILVLLIGHLNVKIVSLSLPFMLVYLLAGNVQSLLLMALADVLIKLSWKFSFKPESNVPVLLSTLSDFTGTLMLATIFYLFSQNEKSEEGIRMLAKDVVETVTEMVTKTETL